MDFDSDSKSLLTSENEFSCETFWIRKWWGLAYLPTLERENNGDFIDDNFWLCEIQNNQKHLIYRQKDIQKIGIYFTLMCFILLQQQNANIKYIHQLKSI